MSPPPRFRSRTFYRVVLFLPVLAILGLLATGRLQAYFRVLSGDRAPTGAEFLSGWLTAGIWILAIAPLGFAAWEIGRHHTAARRFQSAWWVGLRTVVRLALSEDTPPEMLADFDRPARDDPKRALAIGSATALFVPLFFLAFATPLRTPGGVLWISVAGVVMGIAMYAHRRAAPYLIDEPRRGLRHDWRLLNPARYHQAGRKFVRLQVVASICLPIWWLGGAAFLLGR
jgi:hypothetical protein